MPGAYSEDLRWRIISYKFLLMRSDEEIAFQLFVCPRTVQRICQKFVLTGNVAAERVGRPVGTTTLHRHEEYIIIEAILKDYISSRQRYRNKLAPSLMFPQCVGHFTDLGSLTRRSV